MAINDRSWKFLRDATGLSLPYNDLYRRYLKGLGNTGTLQDMLGKSKKGLNPAPNSGNPARRSSAPSTAGQPIGLLLILTKAA